MGNGDRRMLAEARRDYARKLKDQFLGGAARFLLQDQDPKGIEKLEGRLVNEFDLALQFSCLVWSREDVLSFRGAQDLQLPAPGTADDSTSPSSFFNDLMQIHQVTMKPPPSASDAGADGEKDTKEPEGEQEKQQPESKLASFEKLKDDGEHHGVVIVLQPAVEAISGPNSSGADLGLGFSPLSPVDVQAGLPRVCAKAQIWRALPAPAASQAATTTNSTPEPASPTSKSESSPTSAGRSAQAGPGSLRIATAWQASDSTVPFSPVRSPLEMLPSLTFQQVP